MILKQARVQKWWRIKGGFWQKQIVVSFQGPIDSYTGTDCSKYSNQHQTTFF